MPTTATRDRSVARERILTALRALPDFSSGMDVAELALRAGIGAHRAHGIICELVADDLAGERLTLAGPRYTAA